MNGRSRRWYLRLRRAAGRVRRAASARIGPSDAAPRPTGRPPQVDRRTTHLGPVLDDAVHRAELATPVGVDPDHDLVRGELDALHYLLQRRGLLSSPDVDLVDHFLQHGVEDESSPEPHFSMTNYLRQHPRSAAAGRHPYVEWLRRGRDAGEFADPVPRPDLLAPLLGMEADDLVSRIVARRTDLVARLRTGRLGEMVARAAEIEPLIGSAWPAMTRPLLMPLTTLEVVAGMSALHRSHEAADFRPARVVLVVNEARRMADLGMEGHLTHALARYVDPEDIVVVHTDASVEDPFDRHPAGVRVVDFARFAADLPRGAAPEERGDEDAAEQTLVTLLRSFRADAIVNIRSRLLFRAMQTYTPALTASERLFICLSGNTQTAMGTWDGWGLHYFYRTYDRVAGVLVDNRHVERQLTETYQMPASTRERLHLLQPPVDTDLPLVQPAARQEGGRPQVFWAGPWTRQRKVSTLLELAARMPDVDFRVWTPGRVTSPDGAEVPPNLLVGSGAPRTSELPLDEADAWLYTAEWDAVPPRLLEVAMTGIPLVGTRVGGASEVIGEDGWPVDPEADAAAYEVALRSVLAAPDEARARARALRDRLVRERSTEGFAAQAAEILLCADRGEVADRG